MPVVPATPGAVRRRHPFSQASFCIRLMPRKPGLHTSGTRPPSDVLTRPQAIPEHTAARGSSLSLLSHSTSILRYGAERCRQRSPTPPPSTSGLERRIPLHSGTLLLTHFVCFSPRVHQMSCRSLLVRATLEVLSVRCHPYHPVWAAVRSSQSTLTVPPTRQRNAF